MGCLGLRFNGFRVSDAGWEETDPPGFNGFFTTSAEGQSVLPPTREMLGSSAAVALHIRSSPSPPPLQIQASCLPSSAGSGFLLARSPFTIDCLLQACASSWCAQLCYSSLPWSTLRAGRCCFLGSCSLQLRKVSSAPSTFGVFQALHLLNPKPRNPKPEALNPKSFPRPNRAAEVFAVLFTQAVYDYNNDNNVTAIAAEDWASKDSGSMG